MPLDAVFLTGVTRELQSIIGMRVDKIHQPGRDNIMLLLRGNGPAQRLLISSDNNIPRIYLTNESMENPAVPPMFCMLLRKHLSGARVAAVTQPPFERVVRVDFDTTDEMGVPVKKSIVAELMARHTNLILVGADERIIDCVKRVDFTMSEQRQVLPGMFYELPPKQEKRSPSGITHEIAKELFDGIDENSELDKWLIDTFNGISPLVAREIAFRSCGNSGLRKMELSIVEKEQFLDEIVKISEIIDNGDFCPVLLSDREKPKDFCYIDIAQYGDLYSKKSVETFSKTLDGFFAERDRAAQLKTHSAALTHTVTLARDRLSRKIALQKKELQATYGRDEMRKKADLITANLYRLQRGTAKFTAQDFFDENCPEVEITLDVRYSPQQNAMRLYKNYNRAKTAEEYLTKLIEEGTQELEYLESVLDELGRATSRSELSDIREELMRTGYVSEQKAKGQRPAPSTPIEVESPNGLTILIGRNNRQNDELTLKMAGKDDMWLHASKIPGSHVIVRRGAYGISDDDLTFAAELAAYHSHGRESSKVPVDYTLVRNIKKPNGAKPGMVVYETYNTAFVAPNAHNDL